MAGYFRQRDFAAWQGRLAELQYPSNRFAPDDNTPVQHSPRGFYRSEHGAPAFTRQQVRDFYSAVRCGEYAGRDAEKLATEMQIIQAGRTGRIGK
jgi:hypothetical protein